MGSYSGKKSVQVKNESLEKETCYCAVSSISVQGSIFRTCTSTTNWSEMIKKDKEENMSKLMPLFGSMCCTWCHLVRLKKRGRIYCNDVIKSFLGVYSVSLFSRYPKY